MIDTCCHTLSLQHALPIFNGTLTVDDMMEMLWPHPDDMPDCWYPAITQWMVRLNRTLAPFGWTLHCVMAGYQQSGMRSDEHKSELQSLMPISYAVFSLKKKQSSQLLNYRRNDHQLR